MREVVHLDHWDILLPAVDHPVPPVLELECEGISVHDRVDIPEHVGTQLRAAHHAHHRLQVLRQPSQVRNILAETEALADSGADLVRVPVLKEFRGHVGKQLLLGDPAGSAEQGAERLLDPHDADRGLLGD